MTSERALAYGRVMRTLEDLGPSKLHGLERQRVRGAADTLLFAAHGDDFARHALEDVEQLVHDLVACDRWTVDTAAKLVDDVTSCGPDLVDDDLSFAGRAA